MKRIIRSKEKICVLVRKKKNEDVLQQAGWIAFMISIMHEIEMRVTRH